MYSNDQHGLTLGSGCGSVGRAVIINSKGPRFESSHQQKILLNIILSNYLEKTKIKKKGREWPFLKKNHGLTLALRSNSIYEPKFKINFKQSHQTMEE